MLMLILLLQALYHHTAFRTLYTHTHKHTLMCEKHAHAAAVDNGFRSSAFPPTSHSCSQIPLYAQALHLTGSLGSTYGFAPPQEFHWHTHSLAFSHCGISCTLYARPSTKHPHPTHKIMYTFPSVASCLSLGFHWSQNYFSHAEQLKDIILRTKKPNIFISVFSLRCN